MQAKACAPALHGIPGGHGVQGEALRSSVARHSRVMRVQGEALRSALHCIAGGHGVQGEALRSAVHCIPG